jgi:beta-1,2-mannobiose phosphorylase / 1,2-beta-oligomannan phosphorylase
VPDFKLKRIGMIMEPRAGDPNEAEGVTNPAAIRARDGQLYLFPRLVARGNYSRIGIARVLFDGAGDPTGVERMGTALEPEADYELSENGGGCEDPRIALCRAVAALCDDVHGIFASRPANCNRHLR